MLKLTAKIAFTELRLETICSLVLSGVCFFRGSVIWGLILFLPNFILVIGLAYIRKRSELRAEGKVRLDEHHPKVSDDPK